MGQKRCSIGGTTKPFMLYVLNRVNHIWGKMNHVTKKENKKRKKKC